MAATTILYTNTDQIRSAIGVDAYDIPDAMIESQNLDLWMMERLMTIIGDYEAFADSSDRATQQLTLWCMCYGALWLLESSPLGIPNWIQSRNDSVHRFPIDFEALIASLRSKVLMLEQHMVPTMVPLPPKIGGKAESDYDPVVGPSNPTVYALDLVGNISTIIKQPFNVVTGTPLVALDPSFPRGDKEDD